MRYWSEDPVYGGFVSVQADDLPTYSDANSDEFMYDADLNTLTPLVDGYGILDYRPHSNTPTTADPAGDGWSLEASGYQLGNYTVDIYEEPGTDDLYAFTSFTVAGVTTTSFFEEVETLQVQDLSLIHI